GQVLAHVRADRIRQVGGPGLQHRHLRSHPADPVPARPAARPRPAAGSAATAGGRDHGRAGRVHGRRGTGGLMATFLSIPQIASVWLRNGGSRAAIVSAVAVAKAESNGWAEARSPSADYGLWQINIINL